MRLQSFFGVTKLVTDQKPFAGVGPFFRLLRNDLLLFRYVFGKLIVWLIQSRPYKFFKLLFVIILTFLGILQSPLKECDLVQSSTLVDILSQRTDFDFLGRHHDLSDHLLGRFVAQFIGLDHHNPDHFVPIIYKHVNFWPSEVQDSPNAPLNENQVFKSVNNFVF